MTPLVPVFLGLVALAGGAATLLSYGPRYRIGRLLSTTPTVSVADAVQLAASGTARYVRVDGRIDSAQDFPDENQRPLVFRRRRLEARRGRRWTVLDEQLEQVPFEVNEALDSIAIDGSALDEGLVVLPRESTGTAGEVRDRIPAALPDRTAIRYRIDQLSAIEHASVLGVPVTANGGTATMTRGLGRPLVITTLEIPEAMRVLAGGRRGRPFLAVFLLGGGLVLLTAGLAWAIAKAVL
ncbi:MAG TPA: hypothetical protein VNF73_12395 [Candidatus Saccharimonadales bacterium]|nr:hypothetical protein [Candidatus Saccharimonadales bacterium]